MEKYLSGGSELDRETVIFVFYGRDVTYVRTAQLYAECYKNHVLWDNIHLLSATLANFEQLWKTSQKERRIILHYVGIGFHKDHKIMLNSGEFLMLKDMLKAAGFTNLTLVFDNSNFTPEENIRTQQLSFPAIPLLLKWEGFHCISLVPEIQAYSLQSRYSLFFLAFEMAMAGSYENMSAFGQQMNYILIQLYKKCKLDIPKDLEKLVILQ